MDNYTTTYTLPAVVRSPAASGRLGIHIYTYRCVRNKYRYVYI